MTGSATDQRLLKLASIPAPLSASAIASKADPRVDTTNALLKKVVSNTADLDAEYEEFNVS